MDTTIIIELKLEKNSVVYTCLGSVLEKQLWKFCNPSVAAMALWVSGFARGPVSMFVFDQS